MNTIVSQDDEIKGYKGYNRYRNPPKDSSPLMREG